MVQEREQKKKKQGKKEIPSPSTTLREKSVMPTIRENGERIKSKGNEKKKKEIDKKRKRETHWKWNRILL